VAGKLPATVKACEVRLADSTNTHIQIPARSYLKYEPQIQTDYRVNITCGHDPLYRANPGEHPLGVAVDVGTTTVALLLVDLTNGKVVGHSAMFNQQINQADDVVTRIQLCSDKAMIARQQSAVADETILPLLIRRPSANVSRPGKGQMLLDCR